jgi:hypothetical protein
MPDSWRRNPSHGVWGRNGGRAKGFIHDVARLRPEGRGRRSRSDKEVDHAKRFLATRVGDRVGDHHGVGDGLQPKLDAGPGFVSGTPPTVLGMGCGIRRLSVADDGLGQRSSPDAAPTGVQRFVVAATDPGWFTGGFPGTAVVLVDPRSGTDRPAATGSPPSPGLYPRPGCGIRAARRSPGPPDPSGAYSILGHRASPSPTRPEFTAALGPAVDA